MTKSILPTKRQVVAELRYLCKSGGGYYSDPHTFRCLERALKAVKEWKPKK